MSLQMASHQPPGLDTGRTGFTFKETLIAKQKYPTAEKGAKLNIGPDGFMVRMEKAL